MFNDLKQLKKILITTPGDYIDDIYGKGNAAAEIVSIIKENLK